MNNLIIQSFFPREKITRKDEIYMHEQTWSQWMMGRDPVEEY